MISRMYGYKMVTPPHLGLLLVVILDVGDPSRSLLAPALRASVGAGRRPVARLYR